MDWADDVAYSVHDLEDGVHAGQVPLGRIDADAVAPPRRADRLRHGAGDLRGSTTSWSRSPGGCTRYDGTLRGAGRRQADDQRAHRRGSPRRSYGRPARRTATAPLRRYDADLVVPDADRAECALLKAIAVHYVMLRPAGALQEQQRELLAELVEPLVARAPDALEPVLRRAVAPGRGRRGQRLRVVDRPGRVAHRPVGGALARPARAVR